MTEINNDEIKVLISKYDLKSFSKDMISVFSDCISKYGDSNTEYKENEVDLFAEDLSLQVKKLINDLFIAKINEESSNV